MKIRNLVIILLLCLVLSVLADACENGKNDQDNDDDDDSNSGDDSGDGTNGDDGGAFELDGVSIIGRTTDAEGFVEFTVDGQGTLGLYVLDEGQTDRLLPGIKVYLITKDGQAAILALDETGVYLPFLADVATLANVETKRASTMMAGVFNQEYLLGLPRNFAASVNEPMVISARIAPDLLRVLLIFFFESAGTETLAGLETKVGSLANQATTAKIIQLALFTDPETATAAVPVTLAVYDRSHPDFAKFLPTLYQGNCYPTDSSFELYTSNDPLANSSPASFFFVLAKPKQLPDVSGNVDLLVEVLDAVSDAPIGGARLTLSPVGLVAYTNSAGQHPFADLPLCAGREGSGFYLRISKFGYYPAQFVLDALTPEVLNTVTFRLSPITAGEVEPTWINIPAGSYSMGCSPNDELCDADEFPAHTVQLAGFQLTETEITQQQYSQVVGANPSWYADCPDCPVEFLTWSEAKAFCEAVGGRLPTEAEWEYAARAGATTRYYCGDAAACLDQVAWDIFNAGSRTHPAKQKDANAFGLFDILGNVWEFTADYYAADYYQGSPAQNPTGPASGQYRAMRGGSWYSGESNARVSNRFEGDTVGRYANFGFRCAK
ncbi:MAG: formylglycine-generating enzyme family protein [Myxococcales bacterium]|nr:formylglycine-generating enzyme family protein [Myxococcales bacterium]